MSRLQIRSCRKDDISQLVALHENSFPIKYSRSFYDKLLKPKEDRCCIVAAVDDVLVGAITVRREADRLNCSMCRCFRVVNNKIFQLVGGGMDEGEIIRKAYVYVQVYARS